MLLTFALGSVSVNECEEVFTQFAGTDTADGKRMRLSQPTLAMAMGLLWPDFELVAPLRFVEQFANTDGAGTIDCAEFKLLVGRVAVANPQLCSQQFVGHDHL